MTETHPSCAATTEDRLLGGRIVLHQPEHGYRVAVDPVLLAAAVDAVPGETVLDAGAGTGAVALCLAARCPGVAVTALERDPALAMLARRNADANAAADTVAVVCGDLALAHRNLGGTIYDHVMTNPPYMPIDRGTAPEPVRRDAHAEGEMDLAGWLDCCLRRLKPRGRIHVVQRADRLDDILAALHGRAGAIRIRPIQAKTSSPAAGRVLVQARKGGRGPLQLLSPFVLHEEDGRYTERTQVILRDAGALA
ncbi:tRNA1(Val) (adenine(37)-N6)-methyltransferase [Marinivivus vitaminiproducens]|uniref:tRNA1(Val) (adenine(37)-N6)-methyltransferase n=1 Tax=Marinivivus vitaminiproducens TaxID=3035935 RepID=UPI00279E6BD1|nr:methyltransferase [Geminicoccaceae bacterium SCSIO 64248]